MTVPTDETELLRAWAQSLVGRDWEIFWSEGADGGTGESDEGSRGDDDDDVDQETTTTTTTPMDVDISSANNDNHNITQSSQSEESHSSNNVQATDQPTSVDNTVKNDNDKDDDDDKSSEGSIIDDWYAGHVRSLKAQEEEEGEEGKFSFEVCFVGDDTVYDMVLDRSKVRPSARGWIKRTKALLCCSGGDQAWEERLPPDTSTLEDDSMLNEIRQSLQTFNPIQFPQTEGAVEIPTMADLDLIRRLKYLLEVQILLRCRLAEIVNHQGGSAKDINGEPNPTESYVENLVKCMEDLVQACTWYCHCWKLYERLFPATNDNNGDSGEDDSQQQHQQQQLTLDTIIKKFLDAGRVALVGAASIDVAPTGTKRRQPLTPGVRRTKRRRKIMRFGNSQESFLETFDDTDFLSSSSVDQFAQAMLCLDRRFYLAPLSRMIQSLSHFVIDPIVTWHRQARLLLGERDELLDEQPSVNKSDDEKSDRDTDNEDDSDRDSIDEVRNHEAQERFFTYQDVESCAQAAVQSMVLSRLDLSEMLEKLKEKLADIEVFGSKAIELVSQILGDSSPANTVVKEKDAILCSLKELSIQSRSQDHAIFNVDPLGKSSSPLTRAVLTDAIRLRIWLLDLRHAEKVRERLAFVENLASRCTNLPMLPDSLNQNGCAASATREVLSQRAYSLKWHDTADLSVWKDLASKIEERAASEAQGDLMSITSATTALEVLKAVPVILPVEEKIAVRVDTLTWKAVAEKWFGDKDNPPAYTTVTELSKSLELLLRGKSPSRVALLQNVEANEEVGKKLCSFASTDVQAICGPLATRVQTLYSKASKWQDRAESAISSLRMHGNVAAGQPIQVPKLPAMIDIRRIEDLLEEFRLLEVEIPGYKAILEEVYNGAKEWGDGLDTAIVNETCPFESNLKVLEAQREKRPRGILMDPTRHMFDLVVELLTWQQRVKICLATLAERAELVSDHDEGAVDEYSSLVVGTAYPLLFEGADIVQLYSEERAAKGQLEASSEKCVKILEKLYDLRRTSKFLSREKLESNPLGSAILTRMVNEELDLADGGPVFIMLWLHWHALVGEFVAKCDFGASDDEDDESSSSSDDIIVLSLAAGKHLQSLEPSVKVSNAIPPQITMVVASQTSDLKTLNGLISDAEQSESDIRATLGAAKDMLRGSLAKADSVREHLNRLKELLSNFKKRLDGEVGLSLSPAVEPQLDYHIKIFSWLVRTFPYPLLHLDQASYDAAEPDDSEANPRIPFHVLEKLHDRMPCSPEGRTGDFALVALRISELYDAAKKWQEEITMSTMISSRGGKRRSHENTSVVEMEQVQKLAKNPILAKVAMLREGAVNGMIQTSNEFEIQLHDFLGKDYDGPNPDRAPYPEATSLLGKHGEFVLFRLTGSPMYAYLLSALRSISLVSDNVLAETPGKAAFDWIRKAASWINELNGAVTTESSAGAERGNVMVIPATDARRILIEGESIFLVIPEDLKKTLSYHGIMVSTNKQDGTLKVVFKKGGAHHSVGGTAIRWCPLLFASLKADVAKLNDWEREMGRTVKCFNEFYTSTISEDPKTDQNLFKWHEFGEKLSRLLEADLYSLVVNPQKTAVDSYRKLQLSIRSYLDKHSNPDLDQRFSRRKYENGLAVVDDRNLLLESLLYRRSLPDDLAAPSPPGDPPFDKYQSTFRDTCREYLEKALSKGLKFLNMDSHHDSESNNLCLLKAWEIENELFEQFQGELGIFSVSEEYRFKARSLRCNLEDRNNPTLAARVLLGDIKSSELVTMTAEQLASPKTKLARIKAADAAKRNALLTPEIQKKEQIQPPQDQSEGAPIDKEDVKATADPEQNTKDRADDKLETSPVEHSDLPAAPQTVTRSANQMEEDDADPSKPGWVTDTPQKSSLHAVTSSASDSPVMNESMELLALASLISKSSKTNRPPPPPSLITSMKTSTKAPPPPPPSLAALATPPPPIASYDSTSRARGKRVTNSSGSDRFRIEIITMKAYFVAGLSLDVDGHTGVNGYLPERLTEKGRLKIDAFEKFLRDKLSGGKWIAIPLKLLTFSDQDAQEYKKFYKEYELNKRIAMFAVGENCKVFFVTPKFHSSAKANGVSLTHRTSTYAVVLTKDRLTE